jgi:hypothetical protein
MTNQVPTPFKLPTIEAVQRHLALLELEESLQFTGIVDEARRALKESFHSDDKLRTIGAMASLELINAKPLSINGRGREDSETVFSVQRGDGTLFMEDKVIYGNSESQTRTLSSYAVQYLIGESLSSPLRTRVAPENFSDRTFRLESAYLCSWFEIMHKLEGFVESLG